MLSEVELFTIIYLLQCTLIRYINVELNVIYIIYIFKGTTINDVQLQGRYVEGPKKPPNI